MKKKWLLFGMIFGCVVMLSETVLAQDLIADKCKNEGNWKMQTFRGVSYAACAESGKVRAVCSYGVRSPNPAFSWHPNFKVSELNKTSCVNAVKGIRSTPPLINGMKSDLK